MSKDKQDESKLVFIPDDAGAPSEPIGPAEFRSTGPIQPMSREEFETKNALAKQDMDSFFDELDAETQTRIDSGLVLEAPTPAEHKAAVEPWEAEFLRTIESLTGARAETIEGLLQISKGATRQVEYHTEKRYAVAARMRYFRYKKRLLTLFSQGKVPPPAVRGLRAFSVWVTPRRDGIWELILGHESGRPPAEVEAEIYKRIHASIWDGKI